jgi:hypothetical protein
MTLAVCAGAASMECIFAGLTVGFDIHRQQW